MFGETLALTAFIVFWYMTALFIVALVRKDNSVADIAWGPGFLVAAVAVYWWYGTQGLLPMLVTVLVAVWAMRLGIHILLRNWGRGEDWRYHGWRQKWGQWFVLRSFLQVFMLQGLLLIVVSLPVLWVNTFGGRIGSLALIGAVIWLVGFIWETIGDYQLTRFLKDPSNYGHVLQTGLWKYSRHPNYFGEIVQWWGVWLIALSVPGGWMTILGPLTITFLITKVSGIPLLEAKQMQNPVYREYATRTPMLIPGFLTVVGPAQQGAVVGRLTSLRESSPGFSVDTSAPAETPEKMPVRIRKRSGFTAHGFKLAEAFGRGFSKEIFGDDPVNEREIPFDELPETDQLAEMDRVRSLVAELRDLRRNRAVEEGIESVPNTDQMVFEINGIAMSAPLGGADTPAAAIDESAVAASLEKRASAIREKLRAMGRRPGLREAYAASLPALYFELKKMDQLAELRRKGVALQRAISSLTISARESEAGYMTGKATERFGQLRAQLTDIQKQLALREGSSDMRISRVMEVRSYSRQYQSGMMIEVPTVAALKEDIAEHIRGRRHFLIAGHLGGGKTELARQVVRQFMIERGIGYDVGQLKAAVERGDEEEKARIIQNIQPLLYSASEDSSVYDLIGMWKLEGRPAPTPEEASVRAAEMVKGFRERGIVIPLEEAVKILLGQANLVETVFRYTALGQAVVEGRPIIIDEMNMMRNETRGALNNILTARVGQEVALPGNGGGRYVIKPNFVAIGTLNLGAQYGGTKEINAAQLSRWVGREMDYPDVGETFDLILAALLRGDRATLPPDFPPEEYARLGPLAIVTREVQEIFSGKTPGTTFMARATGMEPGVSSLQKSVISPRDLLRKIIEPWRDSGFMVPLDDIIARNILAPAALAMGEEQKFLTELFIRRGFFLGWDEKRFRDAGVSSVSQRDIEVLRATLTGDEFKSRDKWRSAMEDIETRAREVRGAMLIGNRVLNRFE